MLRQVFCALMCVLLMFSTVSAEETLNPVEQAVSMLSDPARAAELWQQMSPEVQAALPAEQLHGVWTQLLAVGGEYKGLNGDLQVSQQGGYHVYVQNLQFKNCFMQCQLVIDASGLIAGLNFMPVHIDLSIVTGKEGFESEDVIVGEEPWQLPGTLTMPKEQTGKVPAVVLVHGSGPSDRDESAGAVKPFRDLAEVLAERGIAVLRYDKRTYVYGKEIASSPDYARFTVEEETIQDAIAAGRLLAADDRIDPQQIYLLGHSMGAMLAPRIVSESGDLFCGMILACGTNKTLLDIMIRQSEDALAAAALSDEARSAQAQMIEQLKHDAAALPAMTEAQAFNMVLAGQPGYYFWEQAQHPTAAQYLTALAKPTLIINGSRDFQVNEQEGRVSWEAVLDLDAPWLTCLWADVNHMLMKPDVDASIAGTALEYNIACTVDDEIVDMIVQMILKSEE